MPWLLWQQLECTINIRPIFSNLLRADINMSSLHRPQPQKRKKRKERTNKPPRTSILTFVFRMPASTFSCDMKQNKTEHFWNSTAIDESSMLSQIQNLRYGSNGVYIVQCSVFSVQCVCILFDACAPLSLCWYLFVVRIRTTFTCERGSLLFIQIESLIQLFGLFSIFNVCE